MSDLREAITTLDEINAIVSGYDPVMKEPAMAILLAQAFGPPGRSAPPRPTAPRSGGHREPRRTATPTSFQEHLDRWAPTRAADRVLLAAFFLSQGDPARPLSAQAISRLLQQHGVGVSNTTRAIGANVEMKRPLMVQLAKKGATRQARINYGITQAGVDEVKRRLDTA